jgi:hypothetical protein
VRRAILVALLGFVAGSCRHAPDPGFAGTWIMNVDGHPFMVLTLEPEDGHYVGTLQHPRQWTVTADGRNFSGMGRDTAARRLTTSAPSKALIRLVSTGSGSPADKDEFEFTLTTPVEGRLKFSDAPFDPWPLTRYAGTATPHVWTGWSPGRSYALQEPTFDPNPEMARIFQADQAVRQSLKSFEAHAKQLEQDDAARREQVRALIAGGQLRAAEDYRLAAMVFQHGSEPRDYLFAHTLALIALEKGDPSASWIAAASLDRYLRSIDRPQIFGLQFAPGGSERQPLDSELLSDALRRELGVPTLAEQQAQMQQFAGKK